MVQTHKIFSRIIIAVLSLIILVSNINIVYADDSNTTTSTQEGYEYYRTEVENYAYIGDINISLDEYERDKYGNLIPYVNNKLVTPGQVVSKVARVTNLANDCWIRIKVDFEFEQGMLGVDESMLTLASDKWLKRGEYWYWPYPVYHGDVVDFLESVTVPYTWDSWYAHKQFKIIISADAVQVRNFTPLFNEEDPWFGTMIEQCVHDEHMENTTTGDTNFSVTFEGGAAGLVKVGDDFFSNWAEMMPGDTWNDVVKIKNSYSQAVKIWFHTENIGNTILTDKLILTIKNGDQLIYNGPLSGTVDKVLLGLYNPGDSSELTYSLYVPWELQNAYALTDAKTKWIFECELIPGKGTPSTPVDPVKTGDTRIDIMLWVITATASMCIIAALILIVRRRKDEKSI